MDWSYYLGSQQKGGSLLRGGEEDGSPMSSVDGRACSLRRPGADGDGERGEEEKKSEPSAYVTTTCAGWLICT